MRGVHVYNDVFQTMRPFIKEVIQLYSKTNPKSNVTSTLYLASSLQRYNGPSPTLCAEQGHLDPRISISFDNGLINDDNHLTRLSSLAPYFQPDSTVILILPFLSNFEGDIAERLGFEYIAKGPYLFPEDGTKWFGAMFMKR